MDGEPNYTVVLLNTTTGATSEVGLGDRRTAEAVASRAERRHDVEAGVVGSPGVSR